MSFRVSVIIPAYNAEKYIEECIESVLHQTYSNVEMVIVNDGSTDNTGQILDEYAEKHPCINVIHTENRGVCSARNLGLDMAIGEYVMFLDSDDFIALNAIELLMTDILENDADISAGTMSAAIVRSARVLDKDNFKVWCGTDALKHSLLDDPFTYSSCAKLYKKDVVDGVRFIEGRRIHEDSYFVFCTFLKNPTVVVRDVCIYNYRENPNSASHATFSDKYFDILYFANRKFEEINERHPEFMDEAKNMLVKSNIAMLQCFLKADDRQYKNEIRACIREVKRYSQYFVPTYPKDRQRFMIARYNLYGLYKFLYRIKYR